MHAPAHARAVMAGQDSEKRRRYLRRRVVAARVVLEGCAVALLELFTAAARAGIVAADLRALAACGLDLELRLRAPGGPGSRRGSLVVATGDFASVAELHGALGRGVAVGVFALEALDVGLLADLDLEELRADVAACRRHHGDEDVV